MAEDNKTPEQLAREIELIERKNQKRRDEIRAIISTSQEMKELNGLLEVQHQLLSLSKESTEEQEKALRNVEEQIVDLLEKNEGHNQVLQDQIRLLKELIETEDEDIKKKKEQAQELKAQQEFYKKTTSALHGLLDTVDSFTGSNFKMLTSLKGLTSGLGQSARSFEEIRASLAVTTGYASKFNDQMYALASNKQLYLTVEESNQVLGSLSTQMAEFNFLSTDTQIALNNLAGEFMNLGVAPETTSEALHLMTRGMGLQAEAAGAAANSMRELADATGQNLNTVMTGFTKLLPQLSRYGMDADRIFTRMTKQARAAGVDVADVFKLEELFDTYECSMATVGKLNAQLGIQINAMEIMGSEHGSRLDKVKQQLLASGIQYDLLHRREQQALASIFQTDEAKTRALFGDPIESARFMKDQKDRLAQTEKFIAATKRMAIAFEQMSISLEPLLTGTMEVVGTTADFLRGFFSSAAGVITPLIAGFHGLTTMLQKMNIRLSETSQRLANLAGKAAYALKFLGPLVQGLFAYNQSRGMGYDTGMAVGRGVTSASAGLAGFSLGMKAPIPHPLAKLLFALTTAAAASYGGEGLFDWATGGPPIRDGETLTNQSTRLLHNGKVSNVRPGEELRVGPIGSFAQQYRAMAAMGSQEVTIKDNRPIKIVLPNGKVLAEAVMPDVTKAVGRKLNPMMA